MENKLENDCVTDILIGKSHKHDQQQFDEGLNTFLKRKLERIFIKDQTLRLLYPEA